MITRPKDLVLLKKSGTFASQVELIKHALHCRREFAMHSNYQKYRCR
ncbi:hypothetical protein RTCIAT899_PB02095 (plasmid) [Rhizobium tropici CIAT 899]|nr:hypothetical protein RTCIAT899_PB02095 [Rhizobium tropici CIAT 899]